MRISDWSSDVCSSDLLEALVRALPEHDFSVDLADMGSGYGYHSGVVFSIYAQGWHDALVRGGRYDGVGRAFGRSRPATGFSLDLRKLSSGARQSVVEGTSVSVRVDLGGSRNIK